MDIDLILRLEARAARVAAALDARPDLGALWRRMVALTEAASSLSLEALPVQHADILRPPLGLSRIHGEPRSARVAQAIYSVMLRPSPLRRDPGETFDRCVSAAYQAALVDVADGGRVYRMTEAETRAWEQGRGLFAETVPRILRDDLPVVLGALAIARLAAQCMPDRQPIAERLIFQTAESELRRGLIFSEPVISRHIDGLDRKVAASWVCTPASALMRGGIQTWDLERPLTRRHLLERLDAALGREAGRLGPLHAWSERLEAESRGKNSRSRRGDFAALLRETPIVSAQSVAEALEVTPRGALKLIDAALEANLVAPLTARRSYRLWAVPVLADMIRDRALPPTRGSAHFETRRADVSAGEVPVASAQPAVPEDPGFDRRVAAILRDLDAALEGADKVMEQYKVKAPR